MWHDDNAAVEKWSLKLDGINSTEIFNNDDECICKSASQQNKPL